MAAAPTGVNLAQVAAVLGAAWIMDLSSLTPEEGAQTSADIRQRDQERFALEMTGGIHAGVGLPHGNAPIPGPLFKPRKLKKSATAGGRKQAGPKDPPEPELAVSRGTDAARSRRGGSGPAPRS